MKSVSLILLSILILTIIAFVLGQKEVCGTQTPYKCPTGQTCCRSPLGEAKYKCFEIADGECGSDGLSACPKGMKVDIELKTCVAK